MTSQQTGAPERRRRPKDRREQILREAFQLIAASGFNAVSLADVARASGIQKSSVLHHFPSMNDLLLGVLALREEEDFWFYLEQRAEGAVTGPEEARTRLTRVFEHNLERVQLVRLYAVLSAESLAEEHPAHAFLRDRARFARVEVARALHWKDAPELAAAEMLAFWQGLELTWLQCPELDARAIWEHFCERFFV